MSHSQFFLIFQFQTTKEMTTNLESQYYKVGDLVDAKSLEDGSWWEGRIVKIHQHSEVGLISDTEDGFIYHVIYEGYVLSLLCCS